MTWEASSPFQFSVKVNDVVGQILAQQFQLYYMNILHIPNADWSVDVTSVAQKVLGTDKVFRAHVYGKYPAQLAYSGNADEGCYGSLLPNQYCPAQPGDQLKDEVFVAQLQNKVFVTKLFALGRWWWVGVACTFDVIPPTPFQLEGWKVIPHLPKGGTINAGQELPVDIQVHFKWGTGQRAVAFRAELQLINSKGTVVSDEMTKIFIVSRNGFLPEDATITLNGSVKLPELLPPDTYTVNAILYYSIP